jgi:hypothetical protein
MAVGINKFKGDGDVLALNELGASAEQATFTISAIEVAGGSALNGRYWTFSTDRNNYYVWYNVTDESAGPIDPAVAGAVGIPVSLTAATAASGGGIMSATLTQLSKLSEIGASVTASVLTIVNKEYGVVTPASAVGGSPFALGGSVAGVARDTIAAKHVIHTSAGLVEAIISESGSVWDLAASTYRVEDYNKGFGGSRLGVNAGIVGGAGDDPVKGDNLVLSASAPYADGSVISGVS